VRIGWLAVAGLVVQAVCLALFGLVSRTGVAAIGKPIVYGLAFAGIVSIIWRAVARRGGWVGLCLLPILLGFGYIVAFHLMGFIGLWSVPAPSRGAVGLDFDIAWLMAGIYGIATVVIFAVHRILRASEYTG
jgi:hypothetical protein